MSVLCLRNCSLAAAPFPRALAESAIHVERLDNVLEYSLLIGNGDLNGLVFAQDGDLVVRLTKNDVWDARLDSKLDPPLPTLALVKQLAKGPWPQREVLLPPGSMWQGPDSYHAHAYPCPRALGLVRLKGGAAGGAKASLNLAAATVSVTPAGKPPIRLRIQADANVLVITGSEPLSAELVAIGSADLPAAKLGRTDNASHLEQRIPGDADLPGMTFALALTANQGARRVVCAAVTSRESTDPLSAALELTRKESTRGSAERLAAHERIWQDFWQTSGVELPEPVLQQTWYRNLYLLRCITKPGVLCPGLFAGLVNDQPAWHGDYHTNYNVQQTFWAAWVTGHADLCEPYDRLITEYLPRAQWLAGKIFNCRGAYYPHVLFAYEPADPEKCKSPGGRQYFHHVWGWTLGVTGFTVQPLWLRYLYERDSDYLKTTAYPAVREVALFYADFIDGCEGKEKVVLAPTVSPEHWGWTPNFERNRNGTFDIALVAYTLRAAIDGATRLGADADLVTRWKTALARLPDYPTTSGPEPVVVDVLGAPPIEYNIPVPTTPVFPGDQITWFSPAAEKALFTRSIAQLRHNGNNAAVMLAVARARLSMPDACAFTRQEIAARTRPNGTLTLNRLVPRHPFNDYGHYTEMSAGAFAVSELLLQSVGDVVRVFPAWPAEQSAAFRGLHAQGGFVIDAEKHGPVIARLAVRSTVGETLRLLSPWRRAELRQDGGPWQPVAADPAGILMVPTRAGGTYELRGK